MLPENQWAFPNAGRLFQVDTLVGKLLTPNALPVAMPSKANQPVIQQGPLNPLLGNMSFEEYTLSYVFIIN